MTQHTETIHTIAAGAATAAATALTTNLELKQILFVGMLGAVAYLIKSCDFAALRRNKIATLKTIPIRIITPVTITAIIYYLGTDGFNVYVRDVGHPLWTMTGLLAALNYEAVLGGIGRTINIIIEKMREYNR